MTRTRKFSIVERAAVAFMVVWCAQPAPAGTEGAFMNTGGFGKAAASLTYGTHIVSVVNTSSEQNPCAAVNPQSTFLCPRGITTSALPPLFPTNIYCECSGAPNNIWTIKTYVAGGATADDPELDARVNLIPTSCEAFYTMDSSLSSPDGISGTVLVNASVSSGAAIWLRGFEYPAPPFNLPGSVNDLIANGTLKWDTLLIGPFDTAQSGGTGCNALTIPFTTQTGTANLYFVVDAEAKTLPFSFGGFASPIGGTGGTALQPVSTLQIGGVVTVAFTSKCNGSVVSTSPPTLIIQRDRSVSLSGAQVFSTVLGPVNFTLKPGTDEWQFQWNTKSMGGPGIFQLIATLQDGTQQSAIVKLTK